MSRRFSSVKTRSSGTGKRRSALAGATRAFRADARSQSRGNPRMGQMQLAVLRGARGPTETKSVDNLTGQANIQPFLTAGIVYSPLGSAATPTGGYPVEGAGFYNRIGRRIRMMSLQFSGHIAPGGANTAAVPQQFARWLLVYDRQPNGNFPSVADVLTNYDEAGATNAAEQVFQHVNMNNRDRFQILRDRKMILPALGINGTTPAAVTGIQTDPNNSGSAGSKFCFEEFIKLAGAESHFKASTGLIGDITTGSIFCLNISNADANASGAWQSQITCRLKFLD